MTDQMQALANLAPSDVCVRSVEEAWAYLILRRAELDGRIFGLRYEPCTFKLGATSTGRQTTYTPDFWYIDAETRHLVVVEVVGFRKRERARGDALLRTAFPWIDFKLIGAKVLRDPRKADGVDPVFGLPLPIELRGISVSVAAGTLGRKAEAKFKKRMGRASMPGDEIRLSARECGEAEPAHFLRTTGGWAPWRGVEVPV